MKKVTWLWLLAVVLAGGCLKTESGSTGWLQGAPRRNADRLTICIEPLVASAAKATAYEGRWTATGDWADSARHARFEMRTEGGGSRSYSIHVDEPAPWVPHGADREGPVSFELRRCAGTMTFEGQRSARRGSGVVTFDPNVTYIHAVTRLVSDEPYRDDFVTLFFHEMDLDTASQVKDAWGGELTLHHLMAFVSYHIKPEYIRSVRQAGYEFSPDEIIKLSSYHVPLDMLAGFKRAGYDFSPNQLIKIDSYHLTVDDFVSFRDAGYDFSINEMIKADSYHVPVEMARTLHEAGFDYSLDELIKFDSYRLAAEDLVAFRDAGYDFSLDEMIIADSYHIPVEMARTLHEAGFNYSLDDLIKLDSYHIPPGDMVAFKEAGYDFSIAEIIKADSYHVNVADAVRLKQTGYDFSLDELIKLKSYHVPTDFMIDVYDPAHKPFTADELIAFRQKGITTATIKKIRANAQNQ